MEEKEDRARKEEEEKQARIAKEKEDNRLKREAAKNKKDKETAEKLEESNVSASAPVANDESNKGSSRRRGRESDDEDEEETARAKAKAATGSPMRTDKVEQPASPINVEEVDMSLGVGDEKDNQTGTTSILRKPRRGATGGSVGTTAGSVGTSTSNKSRTRPKGSKGTNETGRGSRKKTTWGKNKTEVFARTDGDDDSDGIESVTPDNMEDEGKEQGTTASGGEQPNTQRGVR